MYGLEHEPRWAEGRPAGLVVVGAPVRGLGAWVGALRIDKIQPLFAKFQKSHCRSLRLTASAGGWGVAFSPFRDCFVHCVCVRRSRPSADDRSTHITAAHPSLGMFSLDRPRKSPLSIFVLAMAIGIA